jgi:hypothetical protein
MNLKLLIALSVVCLVFGCSKPQTAEGLKTVDLGTVNLAYDQPVKHDLGDGYTCVLKITKFMQGQCELLASIEKGGKSLETRHQVPTMLDQPAKLSFAQFDLTVTPHLAQ